MSEEWKPDAEDQKPPERVPYPTIEFDGLEEGRMGYKVGVYIQGRIVPLALEGAGFEIKQKITEAIGGDLSKLEKIELVDGPY